MNFFWIDIAPIQISETALSIARPEVTTGYRFVSLYNGAVGPWRSTQDKARNDGMMHVQLLYMFSGLNMGSAAGVPVDEVTQKK